MPQDQTEQLIDGVIVIECERLLSTDQRGQVCMAAMQAFPDRKVMVLDGGIRIALAQTEQLTRIERKLDTLIAALAEEGEGEQPGSDLEGNPIPSERDTSQTL